MDINIKTKPNLKKRIIATVVDYGFLLGLLWVYMLYFGEPSKEGGYSVSGLLAMFPMVFWFIYFVVIETLLSATVGHQLVYLKVIKKNGQRIGFSSALKRHLLDPIDIFIYGIPGIIAIKKTEKNQRLGDLWADTIVIDLKDNEQDNIARIDKIS